MKIDVAQQKVLLTPHELADIGTNVKGEVGALALSQMRLTIVEEQVEVDEVLQEAATWSQRRHDKKQFRRLGRALSNLTLDDAGTVSALFGMTPAYQEALHVVPPDEPAACFNLPLQRSAGPLCAMFMGQAETWDKKASEYLDDALHLQHEAAPHNVVESALRHRGYSIELATEKRQTALSLAEYINPSGWDTDLPL